MTLRTRETRAPTAAVVAPAPRAPSAYDVARLPFRLVRRGALLLWLGVGLYVLVEVLSFEQTYPDEASRESLLRLAQSGGAVQVLQGVPGAVDTAGGFVAWDAGWFLALLVSVWALLVTTRLLRAEEDAGRADVVLACPVAPVRLLRVQLLVVGAVLLVTGAVVTLVLLATGVEPAGSVLLGAGLAGVGATSAGCAALAAQLVDVRRRAVGLAAGLLGLSFAVRMVASSSDDRHGLLVLSSIGWLDRLRPFAEDEWSRLAPLVLAPLVLAGLALAERARRDAGAARFAGRDRRPPRLRLLGGPVAFGWRTTSGVLTAWLVGVAAFGVAMGALLPAVVDLLEDDATYRRTLEDLGVDVSSPTEGFLAVMAVSLALVFALYAAWRTGALRTEEASGRLEHLLVRPVDRRAWLTGSVLLSLVALVLVVLAAVAGILVGALLAGADVSAGQVLRALFATLPVAVVFGGLAVLAFGAVPRLTVGLPAGLAVLAYLSDLLTSLLDLPSWVAGLSPFHWLPSPPAEPFDGGAAAVQVLVAVVAAAVGVLAFARRDLSGE